MQPAAPKTVPIEQSVDNTVLHRIMSISDNANEQFSALCKVLYTFGGVCHSTKTKYISKHYMDDNISENDDESKHNLPDLAMPLSIKPSAIPDFVWDGSLIENKLYEAIQLPKPRARGAKTKKRRQSGTKRENDASKKQKTVKNAGAKLVTKAVEEDKPTTNNGHADVFAMFGEMFTNGTKPDKRSENVEDVLSSSSSKNSGNQQQLKNTKSYAYLKHELCLAVCDIVCFVY